MGLWIRWLKAADDRGPVRVPRRIIRHYCEMVGQVLAERNDHQDGLG